MLTNSGIEHMMRRLGAWIDGVMVSPHTCRHTYAQQMLKHNQVDLYSLSRLLWHEIVSITQIYLNILEDSEIVKMSRSSSVLMNM